MGILRAAVAVGALALVSACATTGDTPRVAPERSLSINAPEAKVKTAVAALFVQKGFVIKQDSDFVLSFEQPSSDFAANLLLGSEMRPGVDNRVVIQFIGDSPTLVSWHSYIVTNPGTGMEDLTETTNSANNDVVEQSFEQIQAQLESKATTKVAAAAIKPKVMTAPAPVVAPASAASAGGF